MLVRVGLLRPISFYKALVRAFVINHCPSSGVKLRRWIARRSLMLLNSEVPQMTVNKGVRSMLAGGKLGMRNGFRGARGLTVLVLMGGLMCGTWRSDAAFQAGPSSGLRGILPATVPEDITNTLAALPES